MVSVGWCAPEVRAEHPELRLHSAELALTSPLDLDGGSPEGVHQRLRELSNRWSGAQAIMLRSQAIPAAYRIFFHQIGLDPDAHPTPLEQAVMRRLLDGGFRSSGLLADVLLLALVDTGVAVWALDADTLDGPLGIRTDDGGRLVVADAGAEIAVLFDVPSPVHGARARTRSLVLYSLQVPGVSALHVEEALWSCTATLEALAQGL